jgi:glycerol-3-phosphate acyltransferase PlsX
MPSVLGPVVLIDGGANVECKPEYLAQFAVMGRVLAHEIMGIDEPTVGILTIGEEAGKGTELVQEAYALLDGTPGFIGNIEGRDVPKGTARVIVTDGFTGNVALKLYEGAAGMLFSEIRRGLMSSTRGKIAGKLAMPSFVDLRKKVDPEEYGGAYLLGVRGMSVIGHGNSGVRGMTNGIRTAARGVAGDVTGHIEAGLVANAE